MTTRACAYGSAPPHSFPGHEPITRHFHTTSQGMSLWLGTSTQLLRAEAGQDFINPQGCTDSSLLSPVRHHHSKAPSAPQSASSDGSKYACLWGTFYIETVMRNVLLNTAYEVGAL